MALRPEVRKYYNTAQYRRERREFIAKVFGPRSPRCQRCGHKHRLLNLAHLTHDPQDKRPGSRILLCPACHARNDSDQRYAMTRRTWAQRHGQLWLTEELEWAPHPVRTWPDRVRQKEMFEEAYTA